MRTIEKQVFEYDELGEKAKNKAREKIFEMLEYDDWWEYKVAEWCDGDYQEIVILDISFSDTHWTSIELEIEWKEGYEDLSDEEEFKVLKGYKQLIAESLEDEHQGYYAIEALEEYSRGNRQEFYQDGSIYNENV